MATVSQVDIDWRELISKIGETIGHTIAGLAAPPELFAALGSLTAATKAFKVNNPPSVRAWELSILSFAWALNELTSSTDADPTPAKRAVKEILDLAKFSIDRGEQHIPVDFLNRPTSLPLYQLLKDAFIERKDAFRQGVRDSDSTLRIRLDAAYSRAVFEVYIRNPELYQLLESTLETPAAKPAERELDWSAYRRRLVYEFEVKPVFGQEATKISLAQLYVPLRASWKKDTTKPLSEVDDRSDALEYCMLEEALDSWLDSPDFADSIRLIGGGPGSGKSTTLKSFARRVADRPEWRPLLIPLQHISLEGDLRDAINRFFADRTQGDFHHPPLARSAIEDGPPLLLIFDGLDELARPGEAENEVVSLFSNRLANLLAGIRGDGVGNLKVLISGRMPAFQAARRFITPPPHGCLEVCGYLPIREIRGETPLKGIDQRPIWWKQYAALTGHSEAVPLAFSREELAGLTHEPLLCYLLVLSGFATANWEQAAENRNRIYRELVDSIWHRGWGDGTVKRLGPGRTLPLKEFNQLMQTIALAAWQGGDTRVASEAGFEAAIRIAQTEGAWAAFKADNGPDVTNLAMNFYLKAAEGDHRGFEFTHKSFGDYLAARAILDIAYELPDQMDRRFEHAMTDWVNAASSGTLSFEILEFLRNEVRLRIDSEIALAKATKIKGAFERFVGAILSDGLPANIGGGTWRSAETRQANAETMAWAILNSLSLALERRGSPNKRVIIQWPDATESFHQLIRRVSASRSMQTPVVKCFANIVAPRADLFGLQISGIDLRGAEMPGANFSGCHLIEADLSGGNFAGSQFERAMLDNASLRNADISHSDLSDARLTKTEFKNAAISDTIITYESLLYADLDFFESVSEELISHGSYVPPSEGDGERNVVRRAARIRRLMVEIERRHGTRRRTPS